MENAGELKAALTSYSSQNSIIIWALQIQFAKILSALRHQERIAEVLTLCNSRHQPSAISEQLIDLAEG